MTTLVEEPTAVQREVGKRDNDFGAEEKRPGTRPEPLLYHAKPGVHSTPVQKRSPYWQPVDEQS
jgi:hypothetical protein